ncbi:MAG TPA: hypothetical protein VIH59_29630, partial [Candidatus Tectomicrobia bacterium]
MAQKTTTYRVYFAVVRFMQSLTDLRVQCDCAPFDHPELRLFNGHHSTDSDGDGKADDISFPLPEVSAEGYAKQKGYCIPNTGNLFAPGMQTRSGGLRVPLKEARLGLSPAQATADGVGQAVGVAPMAQTTAQRVSAACRRHHYATCTMASCARDSQGTMSMMRNRAMALDSALHAGSL